VFLDKTLQRNPDLIDAAVGLFHDGQLPSNCYVIDLDSVRHNARLIAGTAAGLGLTTYQMTKQYGRNPVVAHAVGDEGVTAAVAVDWPEAQTLAAAGIRIGHLGHLVQPPAQAVGAAVRMRPDQVTVLGVEQARLWSEAAGRAGVTQQILVRVVGPDDFVYPAQRGGVPLERVVAVAEEIGSLPNLRFAGITSFPCVMWDEDRRQLIPTPNLGTLASARRALERAGLPVAVVNAPSANCVSTLPMLADAGATHVEPGSALTGHVPSAATYDEPEIPACVYLTEVTHQAAGRVFTLGGGFYARSRVRKALIHTRSGRQEAVAEPCPPGEIDYYGSLEAAEPGKVSVGDPVVYAFRSQVFVTRSVVAVVAGIGSTPSLVGLFDSTGRPI
jgi:predicted amino acid racemase